MSIAAEPITGPLTGTPEWHDARFNGIFASEAAEACGVSEYGQPLDVYAIKLRLRPPFEGNDCTDRGKRFEPFIGGEYVQRTGHAIETGLPMYLHADYPFIGATPDAVRKDNPRHGVEFKACNFRRAARLGEQGTDQIFEDWLLQTQQQMFVMGWEACDVFVMVDLHTYKLFNVERNEGLIDRMVQIEADLWGRIQREEPPPLDYRHPLALELVKGMYGGVAVGVETRIDDEAVLAWERVQRLKEEIKLREIERDALTAKVQYAMGYAELAPLPNGYEIVRKCIDETRWTQADIDQAATNLGKIKKDAYVTLRQRKSK